MKIMKQLEHSRRAKSLVIGRIDVRLNSRRSIKGFIFSCYIVLWHGVAENTWKHQAVSYEAISSTCRAARSKALRTGASQKQSTANLLCAPKIWSEVGLK